MEQSHQITRTPEGLSHRITGTLAGLSLQIIQTLDFVIWRNPWNFKGPPKTHYCGRYSATILSLGSSIRLHTNIAYAKGGPRFTVAHALHSISAPQRNLTPEIFELQHSFEPPNFVKPSFFPLKYVAPTKCLTPPQFVVGACARTLCVWGRT